MRNVPGMRKPVTKIARNIGWSKLLDMAKLSVFNVVGHALSTVAISRVPVSTVHTIKVSIPGSELSPDANYLFRPSSFKALTPLFTVMAFHFFFKIQYSYITYLSLLPLTLGVMMACTSLSFSANDLVGLSTALASTLIFVAQSIYSKNLIGRGADPADKESKLDKVNILYYSSASSVLLMIPMALYYDGAALWSAATSDDESEYSASLQYIFAMIIANGVAQFFQTFLAFTVLTLVSPVTYSIASLFKRVFVICFAIVWFGQSVGKLQWLGIVLTFFGLYLYNDSKATKSINKGEEKLREEEKNKSMSLPSYNPPTSAASTTSASRLKPSFVEYQAGPRSAQSSTLPGLDTRSNGYTGGYRDMSQVDVTTSPTSARRFTSRRIPLDEVVELGTQQSPFYKDPRTALPSPPPSRSSSSDDDLRSPSQQRQMSLKKD
jgi:solute carrier family 35 protein E1